MRVFLQDSREPARQNLFIERVNGEFQFMPVALFHTKITREETFVILGFTSIFLYFQRKSYLNLVPILAAVFVSCVNSILQIDESIRRHGVINEIKLPPKPRTLSVAREY